VTALARTLRTVSVAVVAVVAASLLSFPLAFVLTPDPTGGFPLAVGLALTAVVGGAFFAGTRRWVL
jgi:ABC-type spermidine/putrescine transport system permease subunit I